MDFAKLVIPIRETYAFAEDLAKNDHDFCETCAFDQDLAKNDSEISEKVDQQQIALTVT